MNLLIFFEDIKSTQNTKIFELKKYIHTKTFYTKFLMKKENIAASTKFFLMKIPF